MPKTTLVDKDTGEVLHEVSPLDEKVMAEGAKGMTSLAKAGSIGQMAAVGEDPPAYLKHYADKVDVGTDEYGEEKRLFPRLVVFNSMAKELAMEQPDLREGDLWDERRKKLLYEYPHQNRKRELKEPVMVLPIWTGKLWIEFEDGGGPKVHCISAAESRKIWGDEAYLYETRVVFLYPPGGGLLQLSMGKGSIKQRRKFWNQVEAMKRDGYPIFSKIWRIETEFLDGNKGPYPVANISASEHWTAEDHVKSAFQIATAIDDAWHKMGGISEDISNLS